MKDLKLRSMKNLRISKASKKGDLKMKEVNHIITMKQYIGEKEYKEINELQEIVILNDNVNLKLELDFKLEIQNNSEGSKKK
ncbi:hypothetical protein BCM18_005653 [Clostridium beijerinckii]|uniref:hypothetical protein n=1 Tax=Clostridium beijerinckii TaxID=1520 RepID=UPI0015FE5305|nr:hypothetical protein [Clostridium beijerinckii]MBA8937711.1 hypothetical protein [Clostridium beijerinckii]